jgi:multicomponent K+:H+ antiporter subunit G
MMPVWLDIAVAIFILLGALFALVGAYGLAKLGDFFKRLHGPTKASTLGVGCVLIASILYFTFSNRSLSAHELLITIFVFMTAPISAHLLVRAVVTIHLRKNQELRPPLPEPARKDASQT